MKARAGEAESFVTTSVIRRHISAPFAFDISVEVDEAGCFYGVEIYCRSDYPTAVQYDLRRAAWYVNGEMLLANLRTELASDLMARLPADADCDIEKAILREVEAVQLMRTASFGGSKRHG